MRRHLELSERSIKYKETEPNYINILFNKLIIKDIFFLNLYTRLNLKILRFLILNRNE